MVGPLFRRSSLQADAGRVFDSIRTLSPILVAFWLVTLAACGKPDQKVEIVQLLDPQENVASASSGARAIATNNAERFPVSNLNDGTPAAWGAAEGQNDVYAAVVLPSPKAIHE